MKFNNILCRLFIFFYLLCHTHAFPNIHTQSKPVNPKYPIETVVKEATTQASPKKKKALVAVFGVFSRSLRKTWPQINRMIVKPLEKDYDVEIYGFNNQIDNINTLDGKPIHKSSADTIKTNHKLVYQEVKQSQLDKYIKKHNSWLTHSWNGYVEKRTRINAVRQFYLEQQVADYISNAEEDYEIVVALIADLYPYVPISIQGIDARDDIIFTSWKESRQETIFSTSTAYEFWVTNGYYLGNKQSVAKIMSTVNLYDRLDKPTLAKKEKTLQYEQMVAKTIENNKLERRTTNMVFCKLRNHLSCTLIYRMTKTEAFRSMSWSQKFLAFIEQYHVLSMRHRATFTARIAAHFFLLISIIIIISRQAIKWFKYSSKTERSAD